MIEENPSVFFGPGSFAIGVTLSKADGSQVVETYGIPEDSMMEEDNTGRASARVFGPQVTVSSEAAKGFGEGDLVKYVPKGEIAEQTFTILDEYSDNFQTTFLLEE